jgi:hypothetical protein
MDEIRDFLSSLDAASEASRVHLYEVWIDSNLVRVDLKDRGPEASGPTRYSAQAYSVDMPETERVVNSKGLSLGNPDGTVIGALDNIHWWIFNTRD